MEPKVKGNPPVFAGIRECAVDRLAVRDGHVAGGADDGDRGGEAFGSGFRNHFCDVDFAEFVGAGDDPDAVGGGTAVELEANEVSN